MRNDDSGCGGCAAIIALAVVISFVGWLLGWALFLAGFTAIAAGFVYAYRFVSAAVKGKKRRREVEAAREEIAQLAADCADDLRSTLFQLQHVVATRGIGTRFAASFDQEQAGLRQLERDAEAVIRQLEIAPDAQMQLQAVVRAEKVRAHVIDELRR